MTIVSVKEASRLTGKSVQTLYRHIKAGTVSKTSEGMDTSELRRVYGELKGPQPDQSESVSSSESFSQISQKELYEQKIESLKRELDHAYKEQDYLKEQIEGHKEHTKQLMNFQNQLPKPEGIVTRVKKFWS